MNYASEHTRVCLQNSPSPCSRQNDVTVRVIRRVEPVGWHSFGHAGLAVVRTKEKDVGEGIKGKKESYLYRSHASLGR